LLSIAIDKNSCGDIFDESGEALLRRPNWNVSKQASTSTMDSEMGDGDNVFGNTTRQN